MTSKKISQKYIIIGGPSNTVWFRFEIRYQPQPPVSPKINSGMPNFWYLGIDPKLRRARYSIEAIAVSGLEAEAPRRASGIEKLSMRLYLGSAIFD